MTTIPVHTPSAEPHLPADGTHVTAVPAVLTSKLDFNARATGEGAPRQVSGPLQTLPVHTAFGSYVKCIVDGWDVDPATIRSEGRPVVEENGPRSPEVKGNLSIGEPSDGVFFTHDPRRAAAMLAEGHDVTVPTEGHADLVRRLNATESERKARFAAEVKDWDEDQHPRDDHGRFTDGGSEPVSAAQTIEPRGNEYSPRGFNADQFRPFVGKPVTVTVASPTAYGRGTFTGILDRVYAEGETRQHDITIKNPGGGGNAIRVVDIASAISHEPVADLDHIADTRTYKGVYPEVDAAIRAAREILTRIGPPTTDEKEAQARLIASSTSGLSNEINQVLATAYEQAASGKTAQQWAQDKFAEWYRQTAPTRIAGMVAYGGARYAEKLTAAIGRAKPGENGYLDVSRWPQPTDHGGGQEEMLQQAQALLARADRQTRDAPLAEKSVAYLQSLYTAMAAGRPIPQPDAGLRHELMQQGFKVASIAWLRGADGPTGPGTVDMFSPEHIAAIVKDGLPPAAFKMPTGRAILAEQAIRRVGEAIDARIDQAHPDLAAAEQRAIEAVGIGRKAADQMRQGREAANKAVQAILDNTVRWQSWKDDYSMSDEARAERADRSVLKMGLNNSMGSQLEDRLTRIDWASKGGSERVRQIVEAVVPFGHVRDAVLRQVDAQAKVLDAAKAKIDKALPVWEGQAQARASGDRLVGERRNATINTLRQVREMGNLVPISRQLVQNAYPGDRTGTPEAKTLMDRATQYFPKDWIAKASTPRAPINLEHIEGRASWNDAENRLRYSTKPSAIGYDPPGTDTMVHEMSHMMEARVPGIEEAENAHWWQRTLNEPTVKLRDVTNIAYGDHEVTRPDEFFTPYVGKSYGSGPDDHYEILSMGAEAVMAGAAGGLRGLGTDEQARPDAQDRYPLNRADPELRKFVLGTLATI